MQEENLHLRPMQVLTEVAARFSSEIIIDRGTKTADAKSLLDVMMLAAEHGPLTLKADGDDAEDAIKALIEYLDRELNKKSV